ncbi:MAG: methylmalonyl-CoA mutase family protein [Bacteroidales bacterium]|jgi:methylmalonyl-CoA mutase|nr:methylmalonyl-CoA mutase small subunit [Bacteroidales bacterium]
MSNTREHLFSEFEKVSTQEWEKVIEKDLKGADYAKKLIWKTEENFSVKPYYRNEDIEALEYLEQYPNEYPFVRGNKEKANDWNIAQKITETNPIKANELALSFIERGAKALFLNAKAIKSGKDLEDLLANIDLNSIALHFLHHPSYTELAKLFLAHIENKKFEKQKIHGSFDFDPIIYMLLHNKFYKNKENDFNEILKLHQIIGSHLPYFQYLTVNANILHNSGATIIQELAYGLAMGNEYLVYATNQGVDIDEIAPKIHFTFSIGSNYFMEIAKLRATRLLWATIVETYQPSVAELAKINITSISSSWNKTVFDAYVNMLRSTTEGMSAAIGGADTILLNSFDETYKTEDVFSQRIARNTQIILKEEAHFDKVIDPSAGSYYIENLTHSLAAEAWKLFLVVEEQGGIVEMGLSGKIKEAIEISCQKRNNDIATRRTILLGTNQYPNIKEDMLEKVEKDIAAVTYEGIQPYRAAIPFEELRLNTEKWAVKNGNPKVFLLKIGNLTMRQARAGFTTNFFGCAGYEIIETAGYTTVDEGVKDALASKAQLVVICSSDEEYETYAPEITKKLKKENPAIRSIVAGNPLESLDMLKAAGIDDFIHIKLDVLKTLQNYNKLLGI